MTLGELIESGLIKDDDTVRIHPAIVSWPNSVRRGKWYEDHILKAVDRPVEYLKYTGREWSIFLMAKEV